MTARPPKNQNLDKLKRKYKKLRSNLHPTTEMLLPSRYTTIAHTHSFITV